ncbi:doxorubicin resistance ABC transporter permease protein DrrB [Tsukamurella pulmonis]|uniref:ABC-2 type transport system permease protein n=1 Tax=Tsukamurella pulmonis TaxID=47312 RepID=A0A1H1CBH8_9ACTN|nr:ABC transporter permease [Tsukamurella pulmonis]KXO89980.1 antibiotic transporter [Tsukamurella pulmonis]BDD84042.1 doxorubicin resistance ABC transporter permease protein DrrB [Tsukamurella pulmonis]SDQ61429.1 ABC-2 type transport system permease protein [Tsukamurella pulmonis]SUP23946.1 Doxorubicin resistance ABC transporter permease protein drrB [Tsukamurella pulmonis]
MSSRPDTSRAQQWWVLTVRAVAPSLRNGELVTQVAASVMFTVGFYIPLKQFMGAYAATMSSYAQYLTPLIVLQAISFAAISGGFRAATDAVEGIDRRFRSMPIGRLTPMAARMSGSMYRCGLALVISLVCGHVIGFRFYGGPLHTAGFVALVLLLGLTLSVLGDLVGTATRNPDATTHLMMLPQLTLGLLSVGVQPVERFPEWIQGFVRDQPISQFVFGLRALAGDSIPGAAGEPSWAVVGPAVYWALGLLAVLLPLHALVAARRNR